MIAGIAGVYFMSVQQVGVLLGVPFQGGAMTLVGVMRKDLANFLACAVDFTARGALDIFAFFGGVVGGKSHGIQ